jgi:hypothetical protein
MESGYDIMRRWRLLMKRATIHNAFREKKSDFWENSFVRMESVRATVL